MNLKGIIAGGLVALVLGIGGIFGFQYRDEINKALSSPKGDVVKPVEPEKPDVPVEAKVLPFLFDGVTLVKYIGTEENVFIPSSYSLGEVEEIELNFVDSMDFNFCGLSFRYPVYVISDSNEELVELKNYNDVIEYQDYMVNNDIDTVTVKCSIQRAIEGNDYGVEIIGSGAFYNNENVKQIIVPASVSTIQNYAISGNTSLQSIYFSNCGDFEFYDNSISLNLTTQIYVPEVCYEKYLTFDILSSYRLQIVTYNPSTFNLN